MLQNPKKIKDEIVQWIQTYFEENGKGCVAVIGISGGKDSSVSAALCAEALGNKRVLGVLMPNGIQSDIEYAHKLVDYLDIPHITVDISTSVDALRNAIESTSDFAIVSNKAELSKNSIINLPARIRMSTLYAIAQSIPSGGRVVNTCNRSEDYVGYAAKFGDGAGDFSPLSHLLVEEVRQIGTVLGLPNDLIAKIPTDGLSGMSDEEKLGFSYQTLDTYIQTGICEDKSVKDKIDRLHEQNLHKLLPLPVYEPC